MWAAEPHMDFFVSFIDLAMLDVQLLHVKTAVQDICASTRGVSVHEVATDYLAAEFLAEAIWLARAGAHTYIRAASLDIAAHAPPAGGVCMDADKTQIRGVLCDHKLPWSVDLLESRARLVITQGGTSFWWRGQGGREASAVPQRQSSNRCEHRGPHHRRKRVLEQVLRSL